MAEPTNIEIYALLIEVKTKLESVIAQMPDHESRIRSLERWRWQLPTSIITAVGSALVAIGAVIYDFLSVAHR
jgi:hypothetical protein